MDLDALRRDGEEAASQSLEMRLGPLLSLVEGIGSLLRRADTAVAEAPGPGPAPKVGLILANRVANDIRACAILSRHGYGIQALTLAASVFEVVGALAYIGYDSSRAIEWASHRDPRRTYPQRVKDGLAAIPSMLPASEENLVENIKQGYEYVCRAKHSNPATALYHGLQADPEGEWAFTVGPDSDFLGAGASARALWYSAALGAMAALVALGHTSDGRTRARLNREIMAANQQRLRLEPWYLTVIERQSDAPQEDEKQAAALLAVARSLEAETSRLQAETSRLRSETLPRTERLPE